MTARKMNAGKAKNAKAFVNKSAKKNTVEAAAEAKLAAEDTRDVGASSPLDSAFNSEVTSDSGAGGAAAAAGSSGGMGSTALVIGGLVLAGGAAAAAAGGGGSSSDNVAPVKTYALTSSGSSVNEGSAVVFTIATDNVPAGTKYDYTITGVQAADVVGGQLTGTVEIKADGKAEIQVNLVADRVTEGAETLTLNVAGQTKSVTINDTSLNPTYALTSDVSAVNEGSVVKFTLATTGVDQGATFDYTITGVSVDDVVGGALSGTAVIDAQGKAVIEVHLTADLKTEAVAEALTVAVTKAGVALATSSAVTVNDTSVDPTFRLTVNPDDFTGPNAGSAADNTYEGYVTTQYYYGSGRQTTYQPTDAIDGGAGRDTLRLFMDPYASGDGVSVANVEVLDLRLTSFAVGYTGGLNELVMTDWDGSLQQINILSNKSSLIIREQQTVADVSISDQSEADRDSSYAFQYTAGLLDGASNRLNLSLDNVNDANGAVVSVEGGMEAIAIDVKDRAGTLANPDKYASNIDLVSLDTKDITITRGRVGQSFILDATVAVGASLNSAAFVGNLNLTSLFIKTAVLGAGDDTVLIDGQADLATSSYNLGAGDNTITIGRVAAAIPATDNSPAVPADTVGLDLGGQVTAGAGDDEVTVNGAVKSTGLISLADGDNTVVAGQLDGDIVTSSGDDTVTVASTTISEDPAYRASINVGDGTNTVTVTSEHDGDIISGSGDDTVTVGSTGGDSTIVAGNGDNTVAVEGVHAGAITTGTGADTISAASTVADSTIVAGDGANTVTVAETHEGSITSGSGDDTVTIGTQAEINLFVLAPPAIDGGTISTGGGSDDVVVYGDIVDASIDVGAGNENTVLVEGNATNSDITVGDGNLNSVTIDGNLSAALPGTVKIGNGNGNELTITGNVISDAILVGSGAGNEVTIGGNVADATVTLGNGGNTVNVAGDVVDGSSVTLGTGADSLNLGDGTVGARPELSGTDTVTSISMGGGQDSATIVTGWNDDLAGDALVQSGGLLDGGAGTGDSLTIHSVDDVNVIKRDMAQVVEIDLGRSDTNNYKIGDVVAVTIDGTAYSYTVVASDIIQGNGAATSANVVNGVRAAIDSAELADTSSASGVLTLTGIVGAADVDVSASLTPAGTTTAAALTVTVVQIANAEIKGFETLNLVATNPVDVDGDGSFDDATDNDDGRIAGDFAADLSLISDVKNINLISEVETVSGPDAVVDNGIDASGYLVTSYTPGVGATSGALVDLQTVVAGDTNAFTLTNLTGAEALSVEATEITATGNRQVDKITISTATDSYKVGDLITVSIAGKVVQIDIDESELTPGDAEDVDANLIATKLAAAIHAAVPGVDAYVKDNVVYTQGQPGVDNGTVAASHARPAEATLLSLTGQTGNVDLAGQMVVPSANLVYDVNDVEGTGPLATADQVLYKVGDVLTFAFGTGATAKTVAYTITAADLAADCDRVDLDTLTDHLAAALRASNVAAADDAAATFNGVITGLTGTYSLTQTRDVAAPLATDLASNLQQESATNDGVADVFVNAVLAAGATDTAMELTVDGRGDFDLSIGANTGANAYTDLALKLADGFDHTIDLNGDYSVVEGEVQGNFSNSVTVADAAGTSSAGAAVTLDEVLAHYVDTTGAKADFTIDQYSVRAGAVADFAGETIKVATGSGDDHLTTLAQSALETDSTIALGTGSNTLSLGWGNGAVIYGADLDQVGGVAYTGGLSQLDILNDVVLDQAATTLSAPGTDEVETVTFTDLNNTGGVPQDLTIEGVANSVSIQSDNDFDLGTPFQIGGTQGVSSLTYDVIALDDGQKAPFTDLLLVGNDLPIQPGNRIAGADFLPEFESDWSALSVPATFGNPGSDDDVDNGQFETYYGTYDEETGVFTVLATADNYTPVSGAGLTHTMLVYDNDGSSANDALRPEAIEFESITEIDPTKTVTLSLTVGTSSVTFTHAGQAGDTFWDMYTSFINDPAYADSGVTLVANDLTQTINVIATTVGVALNSGLVTDGVVSRDVGTRRDKSDVDFVNAIVVAGYLPEVNWRVSAGPDSQLLYYNTYNLAEGIITPAVNAGDIGLLTLKGADGVEITGDATVDAGANARFNLDNNDLTSLTVTAGDDADIYIANNTAGTVAVDAVSITAGDASGDDASLSVTLNSDTAVTLGDVSVAGNSAMLGLTDNTDATLAVTGDVSAQSAFGSAAVNVTGNSTTDVSVAGAVSVKADDVATLNVSTNTDSSVTVDGNIDIAGDGDDTSGTAAALTVNGNVRSDVSLAEAGTVTLTTCEGDDDAVVSISGNRNDYDPAINGPDNAGVAALSNTIALGDLVMDSANDASVTVAGNIDDTNDGELAITLGAVDVLAYGDANVAIGGAGEGAGNIATTVTVGDVDLRTQLDSSVNVQGNIGVVYSTTVNGGAPLVEVDYADINIGNVAVDADGDATFTVQSNAKALVDVGTVTVASNLNEAEARALFSLSNNADSTIVASAVNLTGAEDVVFRIDGNTETAGDGSVPYPLQSSVTTGAVTTDAGYLTTISVSGNLGDGSDVAVVKVDGSINSTSVDDVTMTVSGNQVADIKLGGTAAAGAAKREVKLTSTGNGVSLTLAGNQFSSVSLASTSLAAQAAAAVLIGEVADGIADNVASAISMVDLSVASATNVASLAITNNDGSSVEAGRTTVTVAGPVTVAGATTASVAVSNNTDVDVTLATAAQSTLTIDGNGLAENAGSGDARLNVNGNIDATVTVGNVVMTAEDLALLEVYGNVQSTVKVGSVTVDAGGEAYFGVVDNDDSTVQVAATVSEAGITRQTIDISAAFMGSYAGSNADFGFDVDNASSDVYLGNVVLNAAGLSSASDVAMSLDVGEDGNPYESGLIDAGNITITADGDAYFQGYANVAGSAVYTGDISIRTGLEPDLEETGANVSSDLYFRTSNVEGNAANDGTQSISLNAGSRGTGDGNVFAAINNATDLNLLTIGGDNAEVYLTGSMGPQNAVASTFTLDLSGMTGSFGTGGHYTDTDPSATIVRGAMTTYDPLGAGANANGAQDGGTYVVTTGATFDSDAGDKVVVRIGAGDLIYNAQHSQFAPANDSAELVYSGINWNEDWNDTEGWFSLGAGLDLEPTRQVQELTFSAYSDVEDGGSAVFDVQIDGTTYAITVGGDVGFGDNDEGNFTGSGTLGNTGISYQVSGFYSDEWNLNDDGNGRGDAIITFTGPADGSTFTLSGISAFTGSFAGSLVSNNITVVADAPNDGLGNAASETFAFVGTDIGEVVIGGFRANGFFAQSEVDRLDFSAFADIDTASDLIITIEKSADGYFDDVIIDFVNEAYGSVRLVGAGEYFTDANVNGIANSITFATVNPIG